MATVKGAVASTARVLLIAFNPVVQAGLRSILASDETITLVGHAVDGSDAVSQMRKARAEGLPVDVVITATRTPTMDGVEAVRLIKQEFPEAAVLVLTEHDNDSHVIDAIHAGAGGYIFLTGMSSDVLLQSIHGVIKGGSQIKTALLRNAVDILLENGRKTLAERTAEAAHLTDREVDVLRLLGNGSSNKEIGKELNLTEDTTKKHVHNVVSKLQARSRTHACIIAAQAGIVGKPITQIKTEVI